MTAFRDLDRDDQLAVVMADINRPTAPDLRRELAALLKAAADKFDEWKAAAWREWEPWTEVHHGREQNRISPEMEGPYIEQALARSWNDTLRRMADNLSADEK